MRRSAAVLLAAVAVGVALRLYVFQHLDLRGWPGPAAPQILVAGLTADGALGWAGWLITATLPLVDGEVLAAGRLVQLASTVLACLGAALGGHALAGRQGALAAGLFGGCWGLSLYVSILGGADAPAWGLVWFGVGLACAAATGSARLLPLVAVGAFAAALGAAVKLSAAPALSYLVAAPLLGLRRSLPHALAVAALVAVGIVPMLDWLASAGGPSAELGDIRLEHVREGLARLRVLGAQEGMNEGAFRELFWLALVGAVLPGRAWVPRLVLFPLGVVLIALPPSTLNLDYSVGYRPRWATPSGLAPVLLAACAVALPLRRLRPLGPLRYLPGVVLAGLAAADGLAFVQAWDRHRVAEEDAVPWSGWVPPARFADRYEGQARLSWWSTSTEDGIGLYELAGTAPPGGLLIPALHDSREGHALLGAAAAGVWPAASTRADQCCAGGEQLRACAARVAAELDAAGAMIIVPGNPSERCFPGVGPWSSALYNAAKELGDFERHGAWHAWRGSGSGGAFPCLVEGARDPAAIEAWRYQ